MTDRAYDIVLFGATGFTGKLVAEYLAKHAPRDLKWALAGRSKSKLEAVRAEIAKEQPGTSASALPILVADAHDRPALDVLAAQTRVVCSTVGPYMKYGRDLVAACADKGAHYCDLTGEVPFIRDTIDRNHARAQETGARIVCCCGFDSIPSDLGVLVLAEHARTPLGEVKFFAGESSGGISGGTIASMLGIAEAMRKDRSIRRLAADPYALDPQPGHPGPDKRDDFGVHFDRDLSMWTGPFVMGAVNTRIVRRSNALSDYAYGKSFHYSESMSFGRGPRGMLRAAGVTAALGAFFGAVAVPQTRALLEKTLLPAPGEGPSKEARERGFFVIRFVARTDEATPRTLRARVEGKADPGYGETAKMLGESAMCLARDEKTLPKRAGVLTPATAMGTRLVERLRAAGMVFEVTNGA
jgi:short subunit dehydrogenase-like uncharacterized protein